MVCHIQVLFSIQQFYLYNIDIIVRTKPKSNPLEMFVSSWVSAEKTNTLYVVYTKHVRSPGATGSSLPSTCIMKRHLKYNNNNTHTISDGGGGRSSRINNGIKFFIFCQKGDDEEKPTRVKYYIINIIVQKEIGQSACQIFHGRASPYNIILNSFLSPRENYYYLIVCYYLLLLFLFIRVWAMMVSRDQISWPRLCRILVRSNLLLHSSS